MRAYESENHHGAGDRRDAATVLTVDGRVQRMKQYARQRIVPAGDVGEFVGVPVTGIARFLTDLDNVLRDRVEVRFSPDPRQREFNGGLRSTG